MYCCEMPTVLICLGSARTPQKRMRVNYLTTLFSECFSHENHLNLLKSLGHWPRPQIILTVGAVFLYYIKCQAIGQAIHQNLHNRKFPLVEAERVVAYINRCPDCLLEKRVQIHFLLFVLCIHWWESKYSNVFKFLCTQMWQMTPTNTSRSPLLLNEKAVSCIHNYIIFCKIILIQWTRNNTASWQKWESNELDNHISVSPFLFTLILGICEPCHCKIGKTCTKALVKRRTSVTLDLCAKCKRANLSAYPFNMESLEESKTGLSFTLLMCKLN